MYISLGMEAVVELTDGVDLETGQIQYKHPEGTLRRNWTRFSLLSVFSSGLEFAVWSGGWASPIDSAAVMACIAVHGGPEMLVLYSIHSLSQVSIACVVYSSAFFFRGAVKIV